MAEISLFMGGRLGDFMGVGIKSVLQLMGEGGLLK